MEAQQNKRQIKMIQCSPNVLTTGLMVHSHWINKLLHVYMTEKSLPSLLELNICRKVDVHGPVPPLGTHNVLENYRNTSENLTLTCVMLLMLSIILQLFHQMAG